MTSIDTSTATTTSYPALEPSSGDSNTSSLSSTSSTSTVATTSASTTGTTATADPGLAGLQKSLTDLSAVSTTSNGQFDSSTMIGKLVDVMISFVTMIGSLIKSMLSGTNQGTNQTSGPGSAPSQPTPSPGTSPGGSPGTSPGTGGANGTTGGSNGVTGPKQSFFDVNVNEKGMITVQTVDGYIIRAEGKDAAWTITGPDGKTTRIYGDPHVLESDGGRWDFLNQSTFVFGKNKITVEVVPNAAGKTLTSRITIYSGDERVTISGIDKNKPVVAAVSHDGLQHDASLSDGDYYNRNLGVNGEGWKAGMDPNAKEMGAVPAK